MLVFLPAAAGTGVIAAGFLFNPSGELHELHILRLQVSIFLLRGAIPMQRVRAKKLNECSYLFSPRLVPQQVPGFFGRVAAVKVEAGVIAQLAVEVQREIGFFQVFRDNLILLQKIKKLPRFNAVKPHASGDGSATTFI